MSANNELKDISLLRSKEIDEVIGRPPHWLVQWGITVFFIILVLVLFLSYFIKYPETINVPFTIAANKPLLPVDVNTNGQLIKALVKEGQYVHKNDPLFYWKPDMQDGQQVFISPSDGTIHFIAPLINGQILSKDQVLFFIVPIVRNYYASLYISGTKIKEIKIGQHVLLDLPQYQRQEYGYVNGTINYISAINTINGYYVKVILPDGLKSVMDKNIPFTDGLRGTAEIIKNKRRLIYKFIGKL